MSFLARAKLSDPNRLCRTANALRPLHLYSTKAADIPPQTVKSTKPRTQKSFEPPSSFSQRSKKPTGGSTVWPKPREIPYQAKVANFVNLVGRVKTPVRFESATDGNHSAAIVISQENIGGRSSLLIPVVFEGDLAHVVACHVKENDCVLVSGQLCYEPMRFTLSESLGNLHVVAEDLNFVEGFPGNFSPKKVGVSFSSVEIDKPGHEKAEEVTEKVGDDEQFNQQWKEALEHVKLKSDPPSATLQCPESKPERGGENGDKGGESANAMKDGEELWRDLLKNPLLWWDYRDYKSKGLVKARYPDFKQKGTHKALWVDSAPKWVLAGLGNLEFDVNVTQARQAQGGEGPGVGMNGGKEEDLWRDLVEFPSLWWDNRLDKRNPRAPDFKNKETGKGLWLSDSPAWALSRLPPLRDDQNVVGGKKNQPSF